MDISRRSLSLGIAAASFIFTAGAAQAQTALDDILKARTIKVAIPTDFAPYGFVGPDLQPQGLDIDMANYIAGKLGVKGYLLKNSSLDELVRAVRALSSGGAYFSSSMFTKVLQEFTHLARRRDLQEAKGIDALTDREKDVLRLVARGATNRDIAEELVITENTVKVHLRNILDKLQLRNRQQAAAYAVQEGLISRVIPGNSMYTHPYGTHSSSEAYNLKVVRAQETRAAHSGRRDFIDMS